MKLLAILCLVGAAIAIPHSLRKDNPDERGPYYQGDMKGPLPPMGKNGLVDESYRWPNGVMAYSIDGSFTSAQIDTIMRAMDDYRANSCIDFVERTTERNYVTFINSGSGCYSYVGMIGGAQEINYPDWCLDQYGSVLHEMYHALGFFHEQSRYDRDDYVTIMWENIQAGAENNFEKYDQSYADGFGYSYDYGSMMHYSSYAFSANNEMTIVTTDPNAQDVIGQRVGFSTTDLGKLNAMYC